MYSSNGSTVPTSAPLPVVRRARGTRPVVPAGAAPDASPASAPAQARKARAPRKAPPHKPAPHTAGALACWAYVGLALLGAASALCNGLACAQHAPAPWAGWLAGVATPAATLVLWQVAGLAWYSRRRPVAYMAGGAGAALLGLAVWHTAGALGQLCGQPLWAALPMALAVDCGLVACKLAALAAHQPAAR